MTRKTSLPVEIIIAAMRGLIQRAPQDAEYFQCPHDWAEMLIKRQAIQEVFLLELLATTEDEGLRAAILVVVLP